MSDHCPTCGGPVVASTICLCGLAASYHGERFPQDHPYQRRYFSALAALGIDNGTRLFDLVRKHGGYIESDVARKVAAEYDYAKV